MNMNPFWKVNSLFPTDDSPTDACDTVDTTDTTDTTDTMDINTPKSFRQETDDEFGARTLKQNLSCALENATKQNSTIRSLEMELEVTRNTVEVLMIELDKIKKEQSRTEQENVEILKSELREERETVEGLKSELKEARQSIGELNDENEELLKDMQQFNITGGNMEEMQSELNEARKSITELNAENDELLKDMHHIVSESEAIAKKNTVLQRERDQIIQSSKELNGENDELLNDMHDVLIENEEYELKIREIKAQVVFLAREKQKAEEELRMRQDDFLDPDEVADEMEKIRDHMKHKARSHASALSSLESRAKSLKSERDGLLLERDALKKVEEENVLLSQKSEEAGEVIKCLQGSVDACYREKKALEEVLKQEQENIIQLKSQHERQRLSAGDIEETSQGALKPCKPNKRGTKPCVAFLVRDMNIDLIEADCE